MPNFFYTVCHSNRNQAITIFKSTRLNFLNTIREFNSQKAAAVGECIIANRFNRRRNSDRFNLFHARKCLGSNGSNAVLDNNGTNSFVLFPRKWHRVGIIIHFSLTADYQLTCFRIKTPQKTITLCIVSALFIIICSRIYLCPRHNHANQNHQRHHSYAEPHPQDQFRTGTHTSCCHFINLLQSKL